MKQEYKISMKLFAFVMALLLVFVSMPITAFAEALKREIDNEIATEEAIYASDSVAKDIIVLEENEALREENIKHFKLSDGTTKAVVYPQAVHYKDENGKWVDIDNALTLNGSEYSSNNKQSIKFANKSGSNSLVSIKDGDYKIDFTPLSTNKVSVAIENPQSNNSRKFEDMSVLNNLVSKAIYADIYDGIDIEYILVGNSIKENIIVKEKQDSYTFSFELKLNKLSAELKDGVIILSDSDCGEQVYEIPAPYMYDANNAYSNSVEYSLVQNSKWKYTFTVTADAEWVNADDRAFPVTVDPTIGASGNYMDDYTQNESHSEPTLKVKENKHAYIVLSNLPTLSNDAFVVGAVISLYAFTPGNNYIGIYDNEQTTIGDYNHIEEEKAYSWDISEFIYNYYNYGSTSLTLRLESLSGTGETVFCSREYSQEASPIISIAYRDMKGIESYWNYASHNVGIAGTGSINLKTGNLMFAIPTITATDGLFGFTPTLIYNSALAGQDYMNSNAQVAYRGAYAAKGFKFNGQETVMRCSYDDGKGVLNYYYVWADSDGTEHYFYETADSNVYKDEDGLQCLLEIISTNELTITDANFNKRTFTYLSGPTLANVTKAWYLTSLTDKNGNKLSFTFTQNGKNPTAVNVTPNGESAIELLTIGYSTDSRINLIWNKTSGEACLMRYSDAPTGALNATGGAYLREMLFLSCNSSVTSNMLQAFVGDTDNVASGITVNGVAKYEYDNNGRLIKATDELANYSVEYTINYFTSMIQEVKESGKNQAQGQKLSFNYFRGYTEVKTSGEDDVFETSDDLINVYGFDKSGRVISSYMNNSTRTEIYGAITGEYSEEEGVENKLSLSTKIEGNSANYLLNGNFEASDTSVPNWTISGTANLVGANTGLGWDNAKLRMFATPNGTTSISQSVKLSKGKYTMSLDLDLDYSSDYKIYLKAVSSTNTFVEEIAENEANASGSGAFASLTFEVSETTPTYYTVGVYFVAVGSSTDSEFITVDNIMLAKTSGVSQYNSVDYADFENYSTDTALGKWSTSTGITINNTTGTTLGNSLAIAGNIAEERSSVQTIYTASDLALERFNNGGSGKTSEATLFTISGLGKGSTAMNSEKSKFQIRLEILYMDLNYDENGNINYQYIKNEETAAKFQVSSGGWQFASDTFILPENCMVKEIKVYCEYSNNIGTAYFDNIVLTCDKSGNTTRYTYTEEGKIESEINGALNATYYVYNDRGDVTDVISKRSRTSYAYDDNHNVIETKNYYHSIVTVSNMDIDNLISKCETMQVLKSTTVVSYNRYGLIADTTTYDASNNQYIKSIYTYDTVASSKLFGVLKQETDSFRKTTQYFYDSKNGQLISVISSDNTGYYYTYDKLGNLIMVQPATTYVGAEPVENSSQVQFVYNDNNELEEIIANGTTYVFTYDEFGNQESISIGNNQIVSQETNPYNGKTTKVTYANGTTVEYSYDYLNRVTEVKYTNETSEEIIYNYEYDSNGNLCKFVDGGNGTTTIYKYDASGRLVKMIEYDTVEKKNNFGVSYHYDEESRLSDLFYYEDYVDNSASISNVYVYYDLVYNTNNSLRYINVNVGNSRKYRLNYTYDDFDRYATKVINFGSIDFSTSYEYLSYDNATSALVSTYTISVGNESQSFNYTYDSALQNITEIRDGNGSLLYRYTYDNLDRLVREDNSVTNKTYLYTYDNNGNIREEIVFVYTLGDAFDSTYIDGSLWTYGNSQWGDQLTNYNGVNIYYDSMGNPIRYYNGLEFTWDNVNNLASISDGWLINTYTYNDSGIRTSKTINGVTHTYHLDGTRILSEEYGNKLILYIYDEMGSIIGMAYRTSSYASGVFDYYLFTKNLQGDILSIYDTNGNCVASYTYNAWGECTTTNHTSAYIGNINPFRYRGYYYDTETGLYYLNARYYDPEIKRFLNPDTLDNLGANGDLNGFNLYAYCSNNPVMYVDPTGEWIVDIGSSEYFFCIGGVSLGVSLALDSYGNIALTTKYANTANNKGAILGLLGAGVSTTCAFSWETDSVYDMNGYSVSLSYAFLGIETDKEMNKLTSISISPPSLGKSVGTQGALTISKTEVIGAVNVVSIWNSVKTGVKKISTDVGDYVKEKWNAFVDFLF